MSSAAGGARWRLRWRDRRGEGAVLASVLALPLFAVLISFMAYFGRGLYARLAVEEAAAVGARFAVASLSGRKGCEQAREAMLRALAGYSLDPARATLIVRPLAGWDRGARAEVRVAYTVPALPGLYFSRSLGDPTVSARYEVVIDRHNNRYSNGWQPCVAEPIAAWQAGHR